LQASEECVRHGRSAIVLECGAQFLRKSAESLVETRNSVQNLEGSLRALSQEVSIKKRELIEVSKTESLAGKALPSLDDLFAQASEATSAHSQEILGCLAAVTDGQFREADGGGD